MEYAIYLLSALVTALCSFQLLAAFRRVGQPLLLWSGLCFAILTLSHALVFVDLEVLPAVDLYPIRLGMSCLALGCMLYGLVWGESD